jgi:hypothetical protein
MDIFAYLDAGSGSVLLQALIGGIAAIGVSLKLFWGRVLRFLRIRRDDEQTAAEPASAPDQS